MDSRTMPYLSKKGFKILLTASVEERAKRISKRDKRKITEIKKAIAKKASVERKLYKKLYGFDQEKDIDVYNLVINTDGFNETQVWQIASSILDSTFCK